MTKHMNPTLGRVVEFFPAHGGREANNADLGLYRTGDESSEGPEPCTATVAYVHSPTCVNLCVTDHFGVQHSITSVPFHGSHGDETPPRPCAVWPHHIRAQLATKD